VTKIIKSKYKVSRRLGKSIWGNAKDPYNSRNSRPGQHGDSKTRGSLSVFGSHLREKQSLKAHYGRISEKQFKNTFAIASKMKGNTAENFAFLLESRLDMTVYRMKLAPTIFCARQMVSHGHILVNGKVVNIPSQKLKVGDTIELKSSSKEVEIYASSIQSQDRTVPEYLSLDLKTNSGKYVRRPVISDIPYPFEVNFGSVVEFYSR
jgi:small subunit ribosomal protein S4